MEKSSINVFEVKVARKDIGFKISAADVFNQFLYLGDEKGNLYSYAIRMGDSSGTLSKSANKTKNISKNKVDKILCYPQISMILALAGETLYSLDSALNRFYGHASKISDFAINETFSNGPKNLSVVAISRKKQGFVFVYNPDSKQLEDIKLKFSLSEVPVCVAYTGAYIILANKRDYESINVEKSFAMKKSPIQSKFPYVRAVAAQEILCFTDDIGLMMTPEFEPKPKDSIVINRPVSSIALAGNFCFVLFQNCLQVYLNDDKRFSLVQETHLNSARGITNNRGFIYNRDDVYSLCEIPYENQIKVLLEKCRVDDAITLLIQNVGAENEQKIEELKINAVWPLLKKMQFEKVKQLIRNLNFDVREIIVLFPEVVGQDIAAMRSGKAQKTMSLLIVEHLGEKAQKGKDEESQLKKKSKLFLKDVLEIKREAYISEYNANKFKKREFYTSRNSVVQGKFEQVTAEEMLEIIDFALVMWFFEMGMFRVLEEFLLANPVIYCQKQFGKFEELMRNNPKLVEVITLKPRLFTAFERYDEAYETWQKVAENTQKQMVLKTACQEAVNLLAKFEDRSSLFERMGWILQLKPEIAMSFFAMVPLNFIQPDEIIKKFEQQQMDKYLELYLETIVIEKNTEVETYHTKLMLLYLENLLRMHSKDSKEESKAPEFQEQMAKFRKLLRNPKARYASELLLKKIEKCEWLLEDEIYLYSREKRHEDALKRYINKNMSKQAEAYCELNGEQTLTIYFKMLLLLYRSYEASQNSSTLLLKKDILVFLKEHASSPELNPLVVLDLIPDNWMLNDSEGGGIYQFLESSITHTLHEKRTNYTAKHLSEMDLLNVEYNLVQAKRAYLRFTFKKKCVICNGHIADKSFVVYPNANVCHQTCVKKEKNTVCPITKQDFEKTFKH